MLKNLKFLFDHKLPIEHVIQQLVLINNIPMDLSSFIISFTINTRLAKVSLHALYMLNSVLFAILYSSQGKGLQKISLNEEQSFYF